MFKIFAKGAMWALGILLGLMVIGLISWLIVCGIVKLITLCFGIAFTWAIGTGVWLCLCLLSTVMPKSK